MTRATNIKPKSTKSTKSTIPGAARRSKRRITELTYFCEKDGEKYVVGYQAEGGGPVWWTEDGIRLFPPQFGRIAPDTAPAAPDAALESPPAGGETAPQ